MARDNYVQEELPPLLKVYNSVRHTHNNKGDIYTFLNDRKSTELLEAERISWYRLAYSSKLRIQYSY